MGQENAVLAQARSFLFVPGNRPERFSKARDSGADVVILDLEDAVAPADKAAARRAIQVACSARAEGVPAIVRMNPPSSAFGAEDLAWLPAVHHGLAAVMVPKAESAADLQAVSRAAPGIPLLPLIESAAGWAALADIAAHPSVVRLVLGHIDFQADTGLRCSEDERELDPLRFAMAMHTRLANLAPAVDGVTTALDDEPRLRNDTARALRFGFSGKLCIHPRQVAVVHSAIAPTEAEVAWARRVVAADEASGGAAVQLDGRMVDLPVVLQARRLLARLR